MNFDVLIIGAGPIGLACGIEAKKNNLSYLIIEKGSIINSIFNYPTNMTFFSTSERIEIGDVPFVSHGVKPTRREALEYYRRVKGAFDLKVNTYEKVLTVENNPDGFKLNTDKDNYFTKNIIIATGYYDNANMMNVPGEELKKVKHYFDEPHPYAYHRTVVVGAGNSAVDVALELFRVGAVVTMIIREDKIKPSIKYWVKPDIENRIKEGSIKAYFNSEVKEIKENKIIITTPYGIKEIENEFVFAMTGYHPDYDFLKKLGVDLDEYNNPIFNKQSFETNRNGIYLAGVVCGGKNTDKYFIENSIEHSNIIIKQISKNFLNDKINQKK
ncbi:MAG: YpdA family putative bacillithiol disulfide reductase [Bacteroidota bacterium]|nr:YpdA family putative bacillithiol disulfide reductase [Bacteroidota bacterium]